MNDISVFLADLLKHKISLSLNEGKLKLAAPEGALTPELLGKIKKSKNEIIAFLSEFDNDSVNLPAPSRISRFDRKDATGLVLSFAQQRLWFIEQLEAGSAQYNMPKALSVEGNFDPKAAEQALRRIIQRHETLRTVFAEQDQAPVQIVQSSFEFTLKHHDLSGFDADEQHKRCQLLKNASAQQPFDLGRDLMVRVVYVQLTKANQPCRGLLLFNQHHIASDGWSMGVLLKEFVLQYQSVVQGKPDSLPPLAIQYADYAQWQRDWLVGDVLQNQLDYWQKQLQDVPVTHQLTLDMPRPKMKAHQGASIFTHLSADIGQRLVQLASDFQLTPFMLLHAGLALVLSRHSNSDDIVIGTPVANRPQLELEPLIGFFVNTLVLRTDTSHTDLGNYLAHVRAVNLDAQDHQDIPFEQLVEHCKVPRSIAHSPLFQILFTINTTEQTALDIPGVRFTSVDENEVIAKFDLDISASVSDSGIDFCWVFDTSLFNQSHIEQLSSHLNGLLTGIAQLTNHPATAPLADLPMLSGADKAYLITELNAPVGDFSPSEFIHQLFERQAEKTPDNIAVVFEPQSLTYQALNQAANQLAHRLRAQGVEAQTLVGICVERSLDMVIGILAILKAGGAYVPLDPAYPEARLQFILADTGLNHVVSHSGLTDKFQLPANVKVIDLNGQIDGVDSSNLPLSHDQTPDDLAYVIYTSGSTGQPKGVLQTHQNVSRLFAATQADFQFNSNDVWCLFHSIAFDFSVWELWGALHFGGKLVIPSHDCTRDPQQFVQLCLQQKVSVLNQTPSAFNAFTQVALQQQVDFQHLRCVVFGGEPLVVDNLLPWWQFYGEDKPQLINMYGITETTVHVTFKRLSSADLGLAVIGHRLADQALYLLDKNLQLVPYGAVGEIYVGGAGLARGYLNQPKMTNERFIANPFNGEQRLYKTGDLARYLVDGDLVFIGRSDDQVKIRGFRIELGEIEHQLSQCDKVQSALVMVVENEPGHKQLVAYVVASDVDDAVFVAELRDGLQQVLPEQFVPSVFVVLTQWPLTLNGKIDKKALPAPDVTLLQGVYVAPNSDTEKALVTIWAKLLKLDGDTLSVTGGFFELGGHSLLAVRLVAEIRMALQREMAIKEIFEAPTIRALAAQLDATTSGPLRSKITAVQRNAGEPVLTSFAQQRLWFIDQLQGSSAEYNMSAVLQVEGDFDVNAAQKAIGRIIQRHESLRTVFKAQGADTLQIIRSTFNFSLGRHDFTALDQQAQQDSLNSLVQQDSLKSFDLSQDLMIRAAFIALSDQNVLLFNMHHIASDGWSLTVLLDEFVAQYQAVIQDQPDPLPALAIQYADYAHWQQQWLAGEVFDHQLDYWGEQLADLPVVHTLPLSQARSETNTHQGARVSTHLPTHLTERLQQVAINHQLTPFMLLHGALALVLSRHSNSHDIVIGTPVANRMQLELEPLIGFFVNTLVLRVDTQQVKLSDYLAHVRTVNLDAQAHQDIPFEHLVEHCKVPRSTVHSPMFQILFAMNTTEQSEQSIAGVTFKSLAGGPIVAKFELEISAQISELGSDFSWTYDTALFSETQITDLGDHLNRLLTGIAMLADSEMSPSRLADLPMLSAQQRHHLLVDMNDNPLEHQQDLLAHQLFEQQCQKTPQAIAIDDGTENYSYVQLEQKANQLAHYLSEQGVAPGDLLGVCSGRNLNMVVAILAILKTGAGYVPLDHSYPTNRLEFIVQDSGMKWLLGDGFTPILNLGGQVCVVDMDTDVSAYPQSLPPCMPPLGGKSICYLVYTSGSTGQPKGVLMPHYVLVNLILTVPQQCQLLSQPLSMIQYASAGFDMCFTDIFMTLASGGSLRLISSELQLDLSALLELIGEQKIQRLNLPYAVLQQLSEVALEQNQLLPHLKVIISTAEQLRITSQIRGFFVMNPECRLVNHYGPSETHVVTGHLLSQQPQDWPQIPSIGQLLANVKGYILDQQQQLVPFGGVGELHIGHEAIAQGYLNRDDLTKERFIASPFDEQHKLYKTGDLVRYLDDGSLEYFGRADDQVKIRGFRIELGEIESQLSLLPQVVSSVVIVREDQPGQKRLVAYLVSKVVTADEAQLIDELRETLQKTLPDYMVPTAFVVLQELPLTTNGKVDKKALPQPDSNQLQGAYVAPKSDSEKALVGIWASLLKLDADDISVNANFFALGGHSLLAVRLVAEIRSRMQQEVAIKVIFAASTIRALAQHIELTAGGPLRTPIVANERGPGEPQPCSFAQQRLWFIDQLQHSSVEYNLSAALEIEGDFDANVAEQAISRIISRHESLRTVYVASDATTLQVIQSDFDFRLSRHDLTGLSPEKVEPKVMALATEDGLKHFDLSKDLMIRVSYVQLGATRNILLFTIHHITADGWSLAVLNKEFVTQYQAVIEDQPDPLPPLSVQYADYAQWQNQWLKGEVLQHQLDYWTAQLANVPGVHSVPLDASRPEMKNHLGAVVESTLNAQQSLVLHQVAASHQMTPFMLMHGALALVLSRHSHTNDIVIGTPVANRMQLALEPLIGCFVNVLVLRVNTQHQQLADYLAHVRAVNLDAQAHQDIPFEQVVEHCEIPRTTAHTPLFQIAFMMNNTEQSEQSIPGVSFKPLAGVDVIAKYDLDISAHISDTGIDFRWVYDTAVFSQNHVEQLSEHVNRLLMSICQAPQAQMGQLQMMSPQQIDYLVHQLNDTFVDYPKDQMMHELFVTQVKATPDAVAVIDSQGECSYQSVFYQASLMAKTLKDCAVQSEELVGILLPKGRGQVIASLAIMMVGGAYLPLSLGWPESRCHNVLKQGGCRYFITQADVYAASETDEQIQPLYFEALDESKVDHKRSSQWLNEYVYDYRPKDLAYVIFTSGSTGAPKGVAIEHFMAVNTLLDINCQYKIGPEDRVLAVSSLSFDLSVYDIFGLLATGGAVVFPDEHRSTDPHHWLDLIATHGVTLWDTVPTSAELLVDTMALNQQSVSWQVQNLTIRTVMMSGDWIPTDLPVKLWRYLPNADVYSLGGATEGSIWSINYPIKQDPTSWKSIPYGKPLSNQKMLLLDGHFNAVPMGSIGEIFIGGDGVARCYYGDEQRTKERYVYSPQVGERLYRTGDLGRYLPDGNIEFAGRIDDQVKIRGFRIELGEIESQLSLNDDVASALVLAKEDESGEKRLVAYIVAKTNHDDENGFIADLQTHLQQTLPAYMVPTAFVMMDQLPLTANGKIDKKKLPAPDFSQTHGVYVAPQTDSEKTLVTIWASLLNLDEQHLGVTLNFFDLGGHSLLIIKLASQIKHQMGVNLPMDQLYTLTDIRQIGKVIDVLNLQAAALIQSETDDDLDEMEI